MGHQDRNLDHILLDCLNGYLKFKDSNTKFPVLKFLVTSLIEYFVGK